MKLVGFTTCHNESSKGHLERCLSHMKTFCDDIFFLDRSSTDDSVEVAKSYTDKIIDHIPNDMYHQIEHKQMLLDYAKKIGFDWMVWLDGDETLDYQAENGKVKQFCELADKTHIDGFSCRLYNLWKGITHYRTDENWNGLVQPRIWKNSFDLRFNVSDLGQHVIQTPMGMKQVIPCPIKVIHYGFAGDKWQKQKFEYYKSIGQTGDLLDRLDSENGMILKSFDRSEFPKSVLDKL